MTYTITPLLQTPAFQEKLFNPAMEAEQDINWMDALNPEEDDDWDYFNALAYIAEPDSLSSEEYQLYQMFRTQFTQDWIIYIHTYLGSDWGQIAELTLEYNQKENA